MQAYRRQVHYYETDQMGAVHHSNYIRWFEEARVDYMEQMGISYREMEERGLFIPVVSASCEYKSMTRFGDTVLIEVRVKEITNARYRLAYLVTDSATGVLRAAGETVHCLINRAGKALPLRREDPRFFELLHTNLYLK